MTLMNMNTWAHAQRLLFFSSEASLGVLNPIWNKKVNLYKAYPFFLE